MQGSFVLFFFPQPQELDVDGLDRHLGGGARSAPLRTLLLRDRFGTRNTRFFRSQLSYEEVTAFRDYML